MKLKKIKLIAIDSDGVILNDTYSPAIKIFVEQYGVNYTADIERSVWGSPQITAGHNLALACKLPFSGEKVIHDFFNVRDTYLKDHPVQVEPGIEPVLKMMQESGARIVCYGGRDKQYCFDRFLGDYRQYFDAEHPYVDINAFRPGVNEIITDVFKVDYDEAIFIDDINRVAEVCKAFGTGFIGVPARMEHNFQREEMIRTGVKHMVEKFSDITENLLGCIDQELSDKNIW
ncbi:HAD family phosphatase [Salmonella enterica subsp. enterica]|nr:HAD family phosphatase [Salmonella enterica subsp. enterica serovar Virchow]